MNCLTAMFDLFEIALKECNESEYWLELLFDVDSIPKEDFKLLQKECVIKYFCYNIYFFIYSLIFYPLGGTLL